MPQAAVPHRSWPRATPCRVDHILDPAGRRIKTLGTEFDLSPTPMAQYNVPMDDYH